MSLQDTLKQRREREMRLESDKVKLNFWQRVGLEILWGLCRFIAIMPHFVQYYIVQELIYFVIFYCVRYRCKVVTQNLVESFPEKSYEEIKSIRRKFYRNLAEVIVDTVVMAGMSKEECMRRMVFTNNEEIKALIGDRNCIAMTSHLGSWEYYGFWGMWLPEHTVVAVYHKIHNEIFNELFKRLRDKDSELPVASYDSLRFFIRNQKGYQGKHLALGLISDQNPPRLPDSHWYSFLGRDTLFFEGSEQLALKFGIPVLYFSQRKVRRGYYEAHIEMIYDGVEKVEQYEITERYVRKLEDEIRQRPELWVWSHRRWKHRPDGKYRPIMRPNRKL